ncbi:MAG: SurA N-terminal domain-containing protein [Coriobacteriia bacterium]|nr:SurA N-terminal domain-containing protein [Coriobacteriia bacterium]
MKALRALAAVLLTAGMLTVGTSCSGGDVAARVNGEVITKAEWETRFEALKKQGNFNFEGVDGEATMIEVKQRALDELIDDVLIRQEAARRGIDISDAQVQEMIDRARAGFENEEAFNEALEMQGIDPDGMDDYFRSRLTKEGLIESLNSDTNVTDEEIQAYYEQNIQTFQEEEKSTIAHILFAPQDIETAEKVLAEIKGGAEFGGMARQYSLDESSRDNDGQVSSQLPFTKEIQAAIDTLEPDVVYGDVVKDGQGLHIVKVVDRTPERTIPLDEATERIRAMIVQQRGRDDYYNLIQDLREQAEIEVVLQELRVPGAQSGE